jgi:hypothetical protein
MWLAGWQAGWVWTVFTEFVQRVRLGVTRGAMHAGQATARAPVIPEPRALPPALNAALAFPDDLLLIQSKREGGESILSTILNGFDGSKRLHQSVSWSSWRMY